MNHKISVSIRKKILIYFLIMFGIVAVGIISYSLSNQKKSQKLALAILSKNITSLLNKLSYYTINIHRGDTENIVLLRSDIEKLDNYFLILDNGGEFSSGSYLLKLNSTNSSEKKQAAKILSEWKDFKNLWLSISTQSSNTFNSEKILILREKSEFIKNNFRLLSTNFLKAVSEKEKLLNYFFLIVALTAIVGLLLGYNFILNTTIKPLKRITSANSALALGEYIDELPIRTNDEIGSLFKSINLLNTNLNILSNIADSIGNGDFEVNFEARGKKDRLGHALLNMRNNLKKIAEEDNKRNWTNENLANFGELLRIQNDNIEELSYRIINQLVTCLDANQGGFFLLSDDGSQLELKSVFAYEKRKYIDKSISSYEGLTGQCLQEGKSIYLKEVPANYMYISSGLGSSKPASVLLLPLLHNGTGYGVIEIASFCEMDEYKIKFSEIVAEDISSSLSVIRANHKTRLLLRESQEKNELRKIQEKQIREQLKTLENDREEKLREKQRLNTDLQHFKFLVDCAPTGLIVLKADKKIVYFNEYIEEFYKQKGIFISKEISIAQLLPNNELKNWDTYFEKAKSGDNISKVVNWKHIKNLDIYLQIMISANQNESKNNNDFNGWVVRINDISHLQPIRW